MDQPATLGRRQRRDTADLEERLAVEDHHGAVGGPKRVLRLRLRHPGARQRRQQQDQQDEYSQTHDTPRNAAASRAQPRPPLKASARPRSCPKR